MTRIHTSSRISPKALILVLLASLCHISGTAGAQVASAQSFIRDSVNVHGTVIDDHKRPLADAHVTLAAIGGSFADSTRTDSLGRYTLPLTSRTAQSFLLTVSAPGFAPARNIISASTTTHNVALTPIAVALAAVRVEKSRPRATIPQPLANDVGGLRYASRGSSSSLAPGSYSGDILGFAARVPALDIHKSASGMVDGVTSMGLGAGQTSINVDGADVRSIRLPRNASVSVRAATSVYDPSQGGFSGAKLDVNSSPGSNIGSAAVFASATSAAALGSPSETFSVSGAASGYLVLDRLLYSSSAEFTRGMAPVQGFDASTGRNSSGFVLTGPASGSLGSGLRQIGINNTSIPHRGVASSFSTLNRFDFVSDSNHSIALIARASTDVASPHATSANAIGNLFGDAQSTGVGITLLRTVTSSRLAQETSVSISGATDQDTPAQRVLPILQLRAQGSLYGDASLQTLLAGSTLSTASASRSLSVNANHTLWWTPADGRHKVDAGLSLRIVGNAQDARSNGLGVVSFDSVAAVVAGTPSNYSRLVGQARSFANVGTLAGFIGDQWALRPHMSVQGGVRLDVNHFSVPGASANIAASATQLGLNGAKRGGSVDASPRLGFTWDIPTSSTLTPEFTMRGGVGRFVNDARGQAFLPASTAFIGPGNVARLDCSAANIPAIDWIGDSGSNPPASCTDGTLPVAVNTAGTLIASDWKPAASWRGNIGGSIQIQDPWTVSADFTRSSTTRISSSFAANLTPSPLFTLASEANRPVYVDAATFTSVSAFEQLNPVRIVDDIGSVDYVLSDMRAKASLLELSIAYRPLGATSVQVGYAHTSASEKSRGLDGTTAGDPRRSEWSPSAAPAHVMTVTTYNRFGTRASLSLQGRLESGRRYTPLVAGDVNGDGRLDDRAYVAAPDDADATIASAIQQLVAATPAGARNCLRKSFGTIAGQNSCVGPWATSLDASLIVTLGSFGTHYRPSLQVEVINAISGLDAALHGVNGMHGWGGDGMPDNVLMSRTGYDESTQRVAYAVNPAFGSVRETAVGENPFRLRVSINIGLSRDRVAQQLTIDGARRSHPSASALTDRYVAQYPNAGFDILDVADSIGLSKPQRDSLADVGRQLDATLRTIWRPVAERISNGLSTEMATRLVKAARTPSAINYEAFVTMARAILNASQLARLPDDAKFDLAPDALRTMGLEP
ncbi:MAG: carboxypeptidase regulatory-like domain-containing protein [Gemmatimonadaceae bacterium]